MIVRDVMPVAFANSSCVIPRNRRNVFSVFAIYSSFLDLDSIIHFGFSEVKSFISFFSKFFSLFICVCSEKVILYSKENTKGISRHGTKTKLFCFQS